VPATPMPLTFSCKKLLTKTERFPPKVALILQDVLCTGGSGAPSGCSRPSLLHGSQRNRAMHRVVASFFSRLHPGPQGSERQSHRQQRKAHPANGDRCDDTSGLCHER